MKTIEFNYELPPEFIANAPLSPRDSARLLLLGPEIQDKSFQDLPNFLNPGDVIVFNDTKVIPALLFGYKGEAKVKFNLHQKLSDNNWLAFAKPAKKLKAGDVVIFAPDFSARVVNKGEMGEVELEFIAVNTWECLHKYGKMPIPPYIKRTSSETDIKDYQTMFATREGAVAAPTASLHFTPSLLTQIHKRGVFMAKLTLHVGAGTFLPVKSENIIDHKMHAEWGEISATDAAIINNAKSQGGRIIAVGTTVLRLLETADSDDGVIKSFSGNTSIFIYPGYSFKTADLLLTNFHLPESTLLMLVCAFAGKNRAMQAYTHAIASNYRFYSYGDASLIYRHDKI